MTQDILNMENLEMGKTTGAPRLQIVHHVRGNTMRLAPTTTSSSSSSPTGGYNKDVTLLSISLPLSHSTLYVT